MVLSQVFVALALFTASDAFPFLSNEGSFTITQVERRNEDGSLSYVKSGAHALAHALSKYNAPPEILESAKKAAAAADEEIQLFKRGVSASGSVPATPPSYADVEYDCPVTIGSQTFKLDPDTGSSDTWVLGKATGAKSPHTLYSPGSTAKLQSGSTWKIGYGDGSSASGTVYTDTLKFGKTIVTGQAVELATTASYGFTRSDRPADGLMGLAFDGLNTIRPTQFTTFFTTAIKQGLPRKLFTVKLKKGAAGSYNFGSINAADYKAPITYTNADSSGGFWTFTPSAYTIGSNAAVKPNNSVLKGIADTGTTLLLLDDSVVKAYYSKVNGALNSNYFGGWVFPCSTTAPNLSFTIGSSYKATIPGSYMNYSKVNSTHCYGGLQSSAGIGLNIYGDIFLKSQFVVFDKTQATPRLGFAVQK